MVNVTDTDVKLKSVTTNVNINLRQIFVHRLSQFFAKSFFTSFEADFDKKAG